MKHAAQRPPRPIFARSFAAALGLGVAAAAGLGPALAQDDYPSRNITIVIPTREGGGADRDIRNFTAVLKDHLNTNFEYEFYPGAAGQVGYEVYVGKKEPDCYNLLFSNFGPEVIMQVLQEPNATLGDDFIYFMKLSSEPMALFVGPNSPFETIEQLVEEAKTRPVTVAVSRLPHPASIGVLALGEATGAQFQLVPYGGGNPTTTAVVTGEVDAGALPLANPVRLEDQARILTVFANRNPTPEEADNAPPVNEVFGTEIPELLSSRGFGVHTAALERCPEAVETLKTAMREAYEDPAYEEQVRKSGLPTAFMEYGDQEAAMAEAESTRQLAERYRSLLTGQD